MKMKKCIAAMLVALLICAAITGCTNTETLTDQGAAPSPAISQPPAATTTTAPPQGVNARDALAAPPESTTYIFTDSAGREVELPRNIERIAPSGPLAQIVLFTLCPDKLFYHCDVTDAQLASLLSKSTLK